MRRRHGSSAPITNGSRKLRWLEATISPPRNLACSRPDRCSRNQISKHGMQHAPGEVVEDAARAALAREAVVALEPLLADHLIVARRRRAPGALVHECAYTRARGALLAGFAAIHQALSISSRISRSPGTSGVRRSSGRSMIARTASSSRSRSAPSFDRRRRPPASSTIRVRQVGALRAQRPRQRRHLRPGARDQRLDRPPAASRRSSPRAGCAGRGPGSGRSRGAGRTAPSRSRSRRGSSPAPASPGRGRRAWRRAPARSAPRRAAASISETGFESGV